MLRVRFGLSSTSKFLWMTSVDFSGAFLMGPLSLRSPADLLMTENRVGSNFVWSLSFAWRLIKAFYFHVSCEFWCHSVDGVVFT